MHRLISLGSVIVVLTVVLMGCSSLSPSGNRKTFYDIAGVVTDADGHRIENMRLVSDNGNIAYTDEESRWSMTGLTRNKHYHAGP